MNLLDLLVSSAYAADITVDTSAAVEQVGRFTVFVQFAAKAAGALAVLIISFWLAEIAKKIVVRKLVSQKGESVHREVLILVERMTYFGVLVLGSTISLNIVNIEIWQVIGFMGLGIGFALKDLLGNFIAGVVILTQKKFKLGDYIKVGDQFGKITNIETRITEIKALDGTHLIIPNADLMSGVVQNYTSNNLRRICVGVGVHYDTPLADVIQLCLKTVNNHPEVLPEPATEVLALAFGDSSIDLDLRFWVDVVHCNWRRVRSEIIQDVKVAFDKAGVVIPFPMRTLSLDGFDKNLMNTVHQKPTPIPFASSTKPAVITPSTKTGE